MKYAMALLLASSCCAQLPLAGPVSIESQGSIATQFGAGLPCGAFDNVFGGMSDQSVVFSTRCRMEPSDTNFLSDVYVRNFLTGTTTLISTGIGGGPTNGGSDFPSIGQFGRHVVFTSVASNISQGAGSFQEVIYKDLLSGSVELISIGVGGLPSNGDSYAPDVSSDGRFVVFFSSASNLVPGDTENVIDVFLFDRSTATTIRVSESQTGAGGSQFSGSASISGDGRHVLFSSASPNLAANDPGGINPDWLVYDRVTQTTEVASVGNSGTQPTSLTGSASISADGRFVTFSATNSIEPNAPSRSVYLRDRLSGSTEIVSRSSSGALSMGSIATSTAISGDGRFVAFYSSDGTLTPGGTVGVLALYVHDRESGTTIRGDVNQFGLESDGNDFNGIALDSSGRRVAFMHNGNNLAQRNFCSGLTCYDIFVADLGPQINFGQSSGSGPWRAYSRVVRESALNPWVLALSGAPRLSPALIAVATSPGSPVQFGSGALVAWPPDFFLTLSTDAQGRYALPFTWPVSTPIGTQVWAQWGIADPTAPMGIALSNAVFLASP